MQYSKLSLQEFLGDLANRSNPTQAELQNFEEKIQELLQTNPKESEEHHKNKINKFLENAFKYEINTKDRIDAVIYVDGHAEVLIETKALNAPKDAFPCTQESLESKAFYESILYYLRESKTHKNNNIKHIILCNLKEFFIINAKDYETLFGTDKEINKLFKNTDYKEGNNSSTEKFYQDLGEYLKTKDAQIPYTCFHLENDAQDLPLIYKILSPACLLKQKTAMDANLLNQNFYNELLYILGLQEKTIEGKIIITPSETPNTLLDTIVQNLGLERQKDFEDIFSLLITWNNRLLFLRLLESMLLSFKHLQKPFLDLSIIPDFEMLNVLFFEVLAREETKRENIPQALQEIPYLNSSLFDKTTLENEDEKKGGRNKQIKFLKSKPLDLYKNSILKKESEYKNITSLSLLEYLFAFLNAYDFTTAPQDIINHTKTNFDKLINSAVLGLVFEKLNGYKEGSFYTPSFITNYMCKSSIEKVVITKFNTAKGYDCKNIADLSNYIGGNTEAMKEANEIFNTIRICDPSVGSGHFLVSALNALILIKHELGILCDENFQKLKDIDLQIVNDEIHIIDSAGESFNYTLPAHEKIEAHKIQKSLFQIKRDLIENCLFGVDINPNSCEITKLRLWIELLKYSYYKDIKNKYLQTLPNIDINIKCGNSLVSHFPIDAQITLGLSKSFAQNLKESIETYKTQVNLYKNSLQDKTQILAKINSIKTDFKNYLVDNHPKTANLNKNLKEFVFEYDDEIFDFDTNFGLEMFKIIKRNNYKFTPTLTSPKPKEFDKKAQKLFDAIQSDFESLESLKKTDSFEWRFEFPEILDGGGAYEGFDLVIGNPPYIRQESIKELKPHLESHFEIYSGTSDIFTYFYEQGYKILRDGGYLSFITSNKWTRTGYGQKLRNFILTKTKLQDYIDFNGIKVFDNATVDTSIVSFSKEIDTTNYDFEYLSLKEKPFNADDIAAQTPQKLSIQSLSENSFTFSDPMTLAIRQKIEALGTPLKDWDITINYGIKTGYNEAFIIDTPKRDEILSNCDDSKASCLPFKKLGEQYFKCEDDTNDKEIIYLNERERTEQIIRPILRGKDIKRYSYQWAEKWIICTFPSLKLDINDYLSLKNYLQAFMPKIAQSGEKGCRKKTTNKWFETQDNIAYTSDFFRQKIVWAEMTNEPCFIYNEDGVFINQTCYFIPDANKYLLAFLNSNLIYFYMRLMASSLGNGAFRWIKQFIQELPIPKISEPKQQDFITIVDKILESKKENKDTKELENTLDAMVYKLYNLNEEEIQLIESHPQ